MAAALQAATKARDERAAALEAAQAAVAAAECALAGAQAGDGRDGSNRSLQERVQDAKLAQVGGVLMTSVQAAVGVVCVLHAARPVCDVSSTGV